LISPPGPSIVSTGAGPVVFHTASLPVRFEVIATGKVIYSSDDQLRTDFEYLISGEYLDFKYHLDMTRKELLETIKEEHPLL
jgi:hypothetical protein